MRYCFGIDIGGTSVKCGLFTEDGEVIKKWEIPTDRSERGKRVPYDIAAAIRETIVGQGLKTEEILGVGIGVPGPVLETGVVLECPNLGWGRMDVKALMEQELGLPVRVGNDANVAALGEMWKGGGRGYDDLLMITLGTGVGGGLIINGRIVYGANGAAAEIGHMIVNPAETDICGCGGHGHLEQYASATGIVRMANHMLAEDAGETALRSYERLTAKDIFDEAKKGDAMAERLVDQLGSYLAFALTHVAAVADPKVFVVGGGVSKAGSFLLDAIERHYNDNIMTALKNKEFRLAELANDAGIFGAAKMILD
ncbi:MAG: ROK family glucokinase [Lachnospiraceae bacterium]|nr:ROK family glucokinase [Lachnospiraceae bacterium]